MTNRIEGISRRALLGLIFAAPNSLRAALPTAARLLRQRPVTPGVAQRRKYRADASVLLCGMTIFSRKNVGGGYAEAEESLDGDLRTVTLQFAGGSWPEKAHGVNRLGFIQEVVVENSSGVPVGAPAGAPAGAPVDAAYFGFMTSSPEKNFDQAKKAFTTQAGSSAPYTATHGWSNGDRFSCAIYRFFMPSRLTFSDCPRLISEIRSIVLGHGSEALAGLAENRDIETSSVPDTFLNSIRKALLNEAVRTECELVYNGKQYLMVTTRQAESTGSIRLSGTLQESGGDHRTPFQLWFEKDGTSVLPTRIEYKAKSFLKLVFEEQA